MKKITYTILAISIAIFTIGSCKKDKAMDNDDHSDHNHGSSDGTGTLSFQATFNVNGNNYSQDSIYQDDFGNDYKFTFVNIYMSKIRFADHDGNITNAPTEYLLINPTSLSHDLGAVNAGHYHNIYANIGLDSIANHSDPNTYAPSSPLYPQSPSMHWSWNSGYIFYKLEGVADTNNDGTFETTFSYHIGSDGMKREITKVVHKDVVKDQDNPIAVTIDLGKFFNNVNMDTEYGTQTMDNMPLATKIADNSLTVFDFN